MTDEKIDGMQVIYDEQCSGVKYYLFKSSNPIAVRIAVEWATRGGGKIDGPAINMPSEVLVRMACQVMRNEIDAGVKSSPELDQSIAFVRDNSQLAKKCALDDDMLSAIIASLVTVVESSGECDDYIGGDDEELRKQIDEFAGSVGDDVDIEYNEDEQPLDCDILVGTDSIEYGIIKHSIRIAREVIRAMNARNKAKNKGG